MQIKYLEQDHYDEFIKLEEYSFQSSSIESRSKWMKEIWDNAIRIGAFSKKGVLQSALIIRNYEVFLYNKKIKMGGIGNVASYPETRGRGNVNALFHKSLEIMKDHGLIISYLAPFSYQFYRNYGYKLVFEEKEYNIKSSQFNQLDSGNKFVQRVKWEDEIETIMSLYYKKFKKTVGPIVREEWSWNEKLQKIDTPYFVLCYGEKNRPEGYMIYHFSLKGTRSFVIDELVGLNVKAEKVLWEFASSHGSQIDRYNYKTSNKKSITYLFNEPKTDSVFHYGMMARIVDVESFLKEYPFVFSESLTFWIEVKDETAPWNDGVFKIGLKESTVSVNKVAKKNVDLNQLLSSDIQNWTQLFMGTRSAEDIHYQENLCGDLSIIREFESILHYLKPELYDDY